MPVYLLTTHAYRSWKEDDPKGFVQHGEGEQAPSEALRIWRDAQALQQPTVFDEADQAELHAVTREIAAEHLVTLRAATTTPTHVHQLISFAAPLCNCREWGGCVATCDARKHCEQFLTRFKRIAGCRLAKLHAVRGRKWFSHKWDVSKVADRDHLQYLIETYLPKHRDERGIVQIYRT